MSKLTAKTTEWLKEAEQKYVDGMPAVTDENRKRLMQIGLDAVRDELKLRAQKKSAPQQIEKPEQLEQRTEAEEIQLAMQQRDEMLKTKGWEQVKQALTTAPTIAPKPTATIHFAGQQYPGQYTRGELWSDVRQNFKLVLLSATFRRCIGNGKYSELWSMVLYVKLWQGIHEGLKKLEGGKDYTMEELLIRHWAYGEDLKEAGRVLAEFLKQPKPE